MSNKQPTPLEELDLDGNATPEDAQLRHQMLSAFFHAPLDASSQLKDLSNSLIDSIDTAYDQLPKPQPGTSSPPPPVIQDPPPGPSPTPPGPSPLPPGPSPTPPGPQPIPQPPPPPSGPNGWVVIFCILGLIIAGNGIYNWLQPKPPEPVPIPAPGPSPTEELDKDDPAYSPDKEPSQLLYFYFWSLYKGHLNHAFNCWDSKWQATSLITGKEPRDAFRVNHLEISSCPDFDSLPTDTFTEQSSSGADTRVIRVNPKPFDVKNVRYFDYTLIKEDGKWRINTVAISSLLGPKQTLWSYFNAMSDKRWDDAINAYTASYKAKYITTSTDFANTHSAFFLCKPYKDLPSGTFTVIESGDDKQVIQVNTDAFELSKRTINYTLVKDGDDWKIDIVADLSTPADNTGTTTGTTTGTPFPPVEPPSRFQTETINTLKQLQAEMDFVSDRMKIANRRWSPVLQDMQSAGDMMTNLQQQLNGPPLDAWGRPINLPPGHAQYYRDSLIQRYNAQQARYNDLARGSQDCANEYLEARQRYDTALTKYNDLAPQIGWSQLQSNCPAPLGPTGQ